MLLPDGAACFRYLHQLRAGRLHFRPFFSLCYFRQFPEVTRCRSIIARPMRRHRRSIQGIKPLRRNLQHGFILFQRFFIPLLHASPLSLLLSFRSRPQSRSSPPAVALQSVSTNRNLSSLLRRVVRPALLPLRLPARDSLPARFLLQSPPTRVPLPTALRPASVSIHSLLSTFSIQSNTGRESPPSHNFPSTSALPPAEIRRIRPEQPSLA